MAANWEEDLLYIYKGLFRMDYRGTLDLDSTHSKRRMVYAYFSRPGDGGMVVSIGSQITVCRCVRMAAQNQSVFVPKASIPRDV